MTTTTTITTTTATTCEHEKTTNFYNNNNNNNNAGTIISSSTGKSNNNNNNNNQYYNVDNNNNYCHHNNNDDDNNDDHDDDHDDDDDDDPYDKLIKNNNQQHLPYSNNNNNNNNGSSTTTGSSNDNTTDRTCYRMIIILLLGIVIVLITVVIHQQQNQQEVDTNYYSSSSMNTTSLSTKGIPTTKTKTKTKNNKKYSCPDYKYTEGRWVLNETSNDEYLSNRYYWEIVDSTNCILQPWDPIVFCNVLNNRNVLFVGDSVTDNIFKTLVRIYNTTVDVEQYQWLNNKSLEVQKSSQICSSSSSSSSTSTSTTIPPKLLPRTKELIEPFITSSTITYIRNDWLSNSKVLREEVHRDKILIPWVHLIKYYDILIFNTGAHKRSIRAYKANIRRIINYITNTINYTGTIIFRTTPRGHINCSINDDRPIQYRDTDYDRFFLHPPAAVAYKYEKYQYGFFPAYNRIIKEAIETINNSTTTAVSLSSLSESSSSSPKWSVIDITPQLELRPDVHNPLREDCLHVNSTKDIVLHIFFQLLQNNLQGYL